MNAVVKIERDRVVADSRDVAADFDKQHTHVMRSIDAMVKEDTVLFSNFGEQHFRVDQGGGRFRRYRRYDMDRKGFMLLVMGFTGAKALAIKSRWIDAFDAMERALAERDLPAPQAEPVGLPDMRDKLQFVREARLLGGRAAGMRAWRMVDLPDVFDDQVMALAAEIDPHFRAWLDACTERAEGARTRTTELFESYRMFAGTIGADAGTMTWFARQMSSAGFRAIKSGPMWRIGIRLTRVPS